MNGSDRRALLTEIHEDLEKEIKDLEVKEGPQAEAYAATQRDLNRLRQYRDKLTSVLAAIAKHEGPVGGEPPKPTVVSEEIDF